MPEPGSPRWVRGRSLSGGGQGDTFEVVDTKGAAEDFPGAVMKLLKPDKANDPKARRRMYQEVANLKVLHSAGGKVPRVLDGNTERFEELLDVSMGIALPLYFVMELIPGKTLADVIRDKTALPLEQAVGLVLDLLATVKVAAKYGIVHRDIKPENIIVRTLEPPNAVMIDFGLSFNEDDDSKLTSADEALDNKFISLPERRGPGENKRDFRSDLTGLCAILFYCLTGCAPRNLRDSQSRAPHRWPGFTLDQKISNPVQLAFANTLLDVGLSHDLDQRFQTVELLESRLKELLDPQAEEPAQDIETVAAQESAALRKKDDKTRIDGYFRNLQSMRERVMRNLAPLQRKILKYNVFLLTWSDLVAVKREPIYGGDGITQGFVSVAVNNHKIQHQIVYSVVAHGVECVLYRETKEIIVNSPFSPAGTATGKGDSVVDPPTVILRYHGDQSIDEKIWAQDIENSVAKSIRALSKRVQAGYEMPMS